MVDGWVDGLWKRRRRRHEGRKARKERRSYKEGVR
jgi:hypothetical protein